jgi:tetratricopeptide (TPR) repeat protein
MIARLTTWLFYAVVFFLLGTWVGGFSPGLRALLRQGAEQAQAGGEQIYRWANSSIGKTTTPEPAATAAAAPDASPPPPPAPQGTLDSARSAFARGDVSEAISLYRSLLAQKPDDVDARGELGNVLLSAGRLQEAAEAFYATAIRLARSGDGARARALAPVVRRNDPGLGDKLDAELKALSATSKQSAAGPPPGVAAA